jgi:Ni,Fe-hydrogenase III small subunit
MWVLRGLRNGVVTSRWPRRADGYADGLRGPARVLGSAPAAPDGADDLPGLCPTGAIGYSADAGIRLDQGRCVLCGRCVAARPDVFAWSRGAAVASLARAALIVPPAAGSGDDLARVRADLRQRTQALGRSVHIRHVDAGSDGSEEWEVLALLNPVYDVHRLGIFFTASPRHADVLLITGAGSHGMAEPLRRTVEATARPLVVIAAGTDAVSGGLVAPSYAVAGGLEELIDVDVWVPGSPPSPFSLLHALLLAVGRINPKGR